MPFGVAALLPLCFEKEANRPRLPGLYSGKKSGFGQVDHLAARRVRRLFNDGRTEQIIVQRPHRAPKLFGCQIP
jgi:hypothetical protein